MKTSITALALAILFVPAIASAQSSSQAPTAQVGNPYCSSAMTNCMTAQEIRQEARREARREAVREARRAERRASR